MSKRSLTVMNFYECITWEHSIICISVIYFIIILLAGVTEAHIEDVVRTREKGNSENNIAIDSARYLYYI